MKKKRQHISSHLPFLMFFIFFLAIGFFLPLTQQKAAPAENSSEEIKVAEEKITQAEQQKKHAQQALQEEVQAKQKAETFSHQAHNPTLSLPQREQAAKNQLQWEQIAKEKAQEKETAQDNEKKLRQEASQAIEKEQQQLTSEFVTAPETPENDSFKEQLQQCIETLFDQVFEQIPDDPHKSQRTMYVQQLKKYIADLMLYERINEDPHGSFTSQDWEALRKKVMESREGADPYYVNLLQKIDHLLQSLQKVSPEYDTLTVPTPNEITPCFNSIYSQLKKKLEEITTLSQEDESLWNN